MPQHAGEGDDDFAALRVVRAHAAQPQAVFLRAVIDGKLVLRDELVALGRGEAERVAVALQVEEELGAVIVFPLAGVHRAAPQADDHRQMLDANRTLKFAGAAGGALEGGFLGDVRADERLFATRARTRSGSRGSPGRFLWVENLAGVVGGTVLRAAAALDAGVCLQRDELRQVLAGVEAEILVASSGGIWLKPPR